MIQVVLGDNMGLRGDALVVNENMTIEQCLKDNNIDYNVGVGHLNGVPIEDVSLTFYDYNITSGKCFLFHVIKANNA